MSGKHGFPNQANSVTSQFMFPKYLMEYQNVKIKKSKFKSEKSNKKHKSNVILKENEKKKDIKIDMVSVMWPLNICLLGIRTCEA